MSLQSNLLGQRAVLRFERSATFQGLFLLWNVGEISTLTQLSRRSDWILSPRKLQDWYNVTTVCQSRGTPGYFVLNAGRTCSNYLPDESGLTIVCRGPCSLFPLPWIPWLSSPAVSEWVSAWMCLFLRFAAPKADGAARIKWQARCAVIEMLSSVNYEIPNVMAPVLLKIFCPFIYPPPPSQKENPQTEVCYRTL